MVCRSPFLESISWYKSFVFSLGFVLFFLKCHSAFFECVSFAFVSWVHIPPGWHGSRAGYGPRPEAGRCRKVLLHQRYEDWRLPCRFIHGGLTTLWMLMQPNLQFFSVSNSLHINQYFVASLSFKIPLFPFLWKSLKSLFFVLLTTKPIFTFTVYGFERDSPVFSQRHWGEFSFSPSDPFFFTFSPSDPFFFTFSPCSLLFLTFLNSLLWNVRGCRPQLR